MTSEMRFGLTGKQWQTIQAILSEFAEHIDRVDVFGSRAQGNHREHSDLDLVVHGSVDEAAIDRLWTLFQDSTLPFSVDIKCYNHIQYAPLKAHMDAVCKTLFTHEELMQAKGSSPSK